jgi:hypothetical protein
MTDTLIVLPTIGANVEKACAALASVRDATEPGSPYRILVVADECTHDQRMALSDAANVAAHGWSPVVNASDDRRGLVPAYRAGFATLERMSDVGRLVLLEDNVRVNPGWFDALTRTLDAHPEFGWVACGQLENDNAPFTSLCSMLTRECALALDGGPDLAFAPCQFDDGDMFMRALKAGFRPHAVPHKVSHPEARTSRVGTIEDDWQLIEAHRAIFRDRWGLYDFPWAAVPVHRGCELCQP